ncbi:MAG: hypothetical protein HY073_04755 [Deltaproteobacteria bacterium]|nr:hypothetical protein [Deltaproteobacteria bacterium]
MQKTNLQIRIPPEIDDQIARLAPASKSAFVREAIEEKIHREEERRLEDQWIKALAKHPQGTDDTEAWLKAESWDSE